ncbi:MAG: site-specific integrase [Oscillospiraceae bacterium]|nr:site-specific integrase [Oscillospiraceae bacterium]
MPIYKANGKKDGLQKYKVRINYISDSGESKQLTRIAYGIDSAKDLERQLNQELKNNEIILAKKMTVQELFNEYIEIKKFEVKELSIVKNINDFNYYILPIFKNHYIDKITAKMLIDWKIELEKKNLSLNTKRNAFVEFKAMLNYAVKMEYILKNPFTPICNFKDNSIIKPKMNYYTPKEFKKFIKKAKKIAKEREKHFNDMSEWNYYVFFNIAFFTGLRKGEIHALKWSDIDGSYLTVSRSVTQRLKGGDRETAPKSKTSIRALQIPLPLLRILNKHRKRQKRLHNFTNDFRICNGVRDTSIKRKNDDIAKAIGIKRIRIHDFRHSHVSVLANEGINIQEIARRLGHSRVEITWNTYSHLYPREEERAVKILNKLSFISLHDFYTFYLNLLINRIKSILYKTNINADK